MEDTKTRLLKALEMRDMKPTDLAKASKISRGAISQYLAGKVKPKQDKLYILGQALNVSPAWLMGFDVTPNGAEIPNDEDGRVDEIFNDLEVRALARKNMKGASDEQIAKRKAKLKKLLTMMFEDEDNS